MVDGQSAVSSLRHRDIRRLEHQFGSRCQSCVIVKRHAVLLVMDPIRSATNASSRMLMTWSRAIIMADRVILLVPDAGDRLLAAVESNVLSDESEGREGRVLLTDLAHAASPFEALMYDALLTTVLDMETTEFIALSGVAASLLHLMNTHDGTSGISAKQQEELLYLKEHLGQLALRIKGNRRAIADVLEDDSAMALMSLSALRTAPHLYKYGYTYKFSLVGCSNMQRVLSVACLCRWRSCRTTRTSRTSSSCICSTTARSSRK